MTTIGIIGAGHIGSQIARLAVASGYKVVISNSRGPETLSALIAELGPRARAATAIEAAKARDIVVVSIPLKNYRAVPVAPLAGKIPERGNESTTTSELLQEHLPTSKVVKAFNHIFAAALTTDGQPSGTKNRRTLAIAADDEEAKAARPVRLRYGGRGPTERRLAYPARYPATVHAARPRNCAETLPRPSDTRINSGNCNGSGESRHQLVSLGTGRTHTKLDQGSSCCLRINSKRT